MTLKSTAISCGALILIACGDFVPMEGAWSSSLITVSSDDCNAFDDSTRLDVGMTLGDDNTTMTLDLGSDERTTCILENASFDCMPIEIIVSDENFDASLTMVQQFNGVFYDAYSGSVSMDVAVSCEGPDCATVAAGLQLSFPCTSAAEIDMVHSL